MRILAAVDTDCLTPLITP